MLKIRVLKVLCIVMHPSLLFCCRSGQRESQLLQAWHSTNLHYEGES